jgi:cytochrome oxidase Cu insertion factor (SCO1/SenC/PrrC family)
MARARAAALVLAALAFAGCDEGAPVVGAGASGPRTDPQPTDAVEFGPLPDFALRDQRGRTVTLTMLRGRPLVIGALFTTCTGPCPSIARGLARLQDELAATDVVLVVVSVNPGFDTPEVLARYAEHLGADPERWLFLTGAEAEVHAFVRQGLFLAVERSAEDAPAGADPVTHDVRLLAVDRRGQRRGWYTGTDEHQLERLRRRMLHLAAQPSEAPQETAGEPGGEAR